MKQSPNDSKQYQTLTLSNGLRVLLVHNEQNNKAAAALAVNVGHFSDPEHRQGLAHFLEHMLFLGTEKYPDGSEYQKFISQNGGHHNAWTATEHTCFFFDISAQNFEQALDRFSQFFITPLLSQAFVESERKNIDAEFKLKLKDDIRRLYDVHKETINPNHPFAKFSVGSSETLGDKQTGSVREELCQLFNDYYYAQYMTLVLEGPQSIAELADYATQYFADIRSTATALPCFTEPLYLPEHQQKIIHIKPVKNDRQLLMSFALPCIDHLYQQKPESLIAYLLGYEGRGSILSLLKQKQWAVALTAGSGINGSNFKDFNISIALTELGERHIDDIVEIFFSFVALIKNNTIGKDYYDEKQAIAELSFNYQEKLSPLDNVSQLVVNMQHYMEEDYIYGDYKMQGLKQEDFDELVSLLSPNNMRLLHISHANEFDQTSKWYKVPYRVSQIEQDNIDRWLTPAIFKQLFLPIKNPYIVKQPQVLPLEDKQLNNKAKTPTLIKQEDGLNVWFKQDSTFKVPKGYVYVGMDAPITIKNVTNIAMTRLFVDIYTDAITEDYYDAELAGIHYHIYSHQGGLSLQLSGLSEKQGDLLAKLLVSLKNVSFDENIFTLLKAQLLNKWQHTDKSKSISQLFSVLSSTLQPSNPSATALYDALKEVSYQQFISFAEQVSKQVSLDILIHGNWHQKTALAMSETIENSLQGSSGEQYKVAVPLIDITSKGELCVPIVLPQHDHAAVLYYPLNDKSPLTIAKTIVTSQLLSPAFFQEMRTEKQYGYLVGIGYVPIHNFPGIAFYIQSPHTEAPALANAMDEFINNYQTLLAEFSEHEWQQLQHGLAGQLQEKDTSLRIRSQRFWAAITNGDNLFDHKQQVIDALLSLEFSDILSFIEKNLVKQANTDRLNLLSFESDDLCNKFKGETQSVTSIEEITNNFERKY
ncbi:insulinase family protein [Thalassotalea sp. PLHSN55]|uniref:insulinase family protein n=1 Tax=Thalassotalea sp. PLHSN55 TaxID=3435888 RepID=UPI003F83B852